MKPIEGAGTETPGERWVLLSEVLFEEFIRLFRKEHPESMYKVVWGSPSVVTVKVYTPFFWKEK